MPLIECPECGQKVASAASVCPKCAFALSQPRWQRVQQGAVIECHNCGRTMAATVPVCLYCGVPHPRRRHISWPVPVVLVAVLLLVTMVGIWKGTTARSEPSTSSATTRSTPAAFVSPPAMTPRTTGPSTEAKWTSTWVNVREGRGANTRVVRILDPGQRIEVNNLQGRWWVVYRDGKRIGYVANSVVRNESPSP